MNNWQTKKLGEILSLEYGKGLTEKVRVNGSVPVYGSNGAVGTHNTMLVHGPGIVVGRKGSIGEVVWSDSDFWPIDTTYYIRLLQNDKLRYVYYLLQTLKLKSLNMASGVPGLNREDVYKITVSLPSLDVQQQIVEKLDAVRKLQELTQKEIEKIEELFSFTISNVFRNQNFKTFKLSEICDVRDGTHDSPKYNPQGIPLITSKNLKNDVIDFTNVNYISAEDHQQIIKRSFVENGDILFGMIGTIGNPVIVDTEREFSIKNVGLIKFPNKRIVSNLFVKYFLQSPLLESEIKRLSRGGTQKFVSLGNLRNLIISLPSLKEQEKIALELNNVRLFKSTLKKKEIKLSELFESTLNKAMKGELVN